MLTDIETEKIKINKIKYKSTARNIEDEIILYVPYTMIFYQPNNITNSQYWSKSLDVKQGQVHEQKHAVKKVPIQNCTVYDIGHIDNHTQV